MELGASSGCCECDSAHARAMRAYSLGRNGVGAIKRRVKIWLYREMPLPASANDSLPILSLILSAYLAPLLFSDKGPNHPYDTQFPYRGGGFKKQYHPSSPFGLFFSSHRRDRLSRSLSRCNGAKCFARRSTFSEWRLRLVCR